MKPLLNFIIKLLIDLMYKRIRFILNQLLILIIFLNLAACSKPDLLKNSTKVVSPEICLKLSNSVKQKQGIHSIFDPEYQPKKDRISHYYYLTDFISEGKDCDGYFATMSDVRVGSDFRSAGQGKGSSYRDLYITIKVDFYNELEKVSSENYKTKSRTAVSFLSTSPTKDRQYIINALYSGIKDIVKKITNDLKQLQ